jgi:hypothetical protein
MPGALDDIAGVLADPESEHLGQAQSRRARSAQLLCMSDKRLDYAAMMRILRDHGVPGATVPWTPRSPLGRTICMHAESASRPGQTTGSMVCELHRQRQVHWVTATAAPCVSIFKPIMLDVPLPPHGTPPTDRYNSESLWWEHERLHRGALLRDLPRFETEIQQERDALERDFHARVASVRESGNVEERSSVIASCWQDAAEAEVRWLTRLCEQPPVPAVDAYAVTWSHMNACAGIESVLSEREEGTSPSRRLP